MADYLAHGVLRTRGTDYVYIKIIPALTALPSDRVNIKGASPRTGALKTTAEGYILVRQG